MSDTPTYSPKPAPSSFEVVGTGRRAWAWLPTQILGLWRWVGVRLVVGWAVIALLPAWWRWRGRLLRWDLLDTQLNSLIIVSLGVLLATFALRRLAQFPGQRALTLVLPTLLGVALLLAGVLLVLRLPYSLYYLAFASVLGLGFFVASVWLEQALRTRYLAYIPLGGCQDLSHTLTNHVTHAATIHWLRLDTPHLTPAQDRSVQAIVADLSAPELDEPWQRFLTEQTLHGRAVYNNRQVLESLTGRLPIRHLYENDLGSLLPSQGYLRIKQVLDSLAVLLSAPLVLPICLVTALAIRLESPGQVIFTQQRVGQGGRLFTIYKFRSMRLDAECDGAKLASENDARVTRVGKLIRKTRIDELPQFINVLKGEMSLIGPRPEQQSFVREFEQRIPFYNYRHIVKPGISGWAQVTQGYASNEDETALKVQYDFYYIKHIGLALDSLIVIKTLQTMLTGFGAR